MNADGSLDIVAANHANTVSVLLETLGRALREIDPAALKQDPGKTARWFWASAECEVMAWYDAEGLERAEFFLFDQVVHWDRSYGLQHGRVSPGMPGYQADLVELGVPRSTILACDAARVLEVASLPDEIKHVLVSGHRHPQR